MVCTFCHRPIQGKPIVVGPAELNLTFCCWECFNRNCVESHPGTSLAGMILRIHPEYGRPYQMKMF